MRNNIYIELPDGNLEKVKIYSDDEHVYIEGECSKIAADLLCLLGIHGSIDPFTGKCILCGKKLV